MSLTPENRRVPALLFRVKPRDAISMENRFVDHSSRRWRASHADHDANRHWFADVKYLPRSQHSEIQSSSGSSSCGVTIDRILTFGVVRRFMPIRADSVNEKADHRKSRRVPPNRFVQHRMRCLSFSIVHTCTIVVQNVCHICISAASDGLFVLPVHVRTRSAGTGEPDNPSEAAREQLENEYPPHPNQRRSP